MAFILKDGIHQAVVDAMYNDIHTQRSQYFFFLGKVLPWDTADTTPMLYDTIDEEMQVRKDIVYLSRISVSDVCHVIPRIDWQLGTVYDRYDGNISAQTPSATGATKLRDAKFYVLTDDTNVYKCIHNNGGAQSTIKPTGTDYDIIHLSDGYMWKYMYSISGSLQYKFLTEQHMPVVTALTSRFYDDQGITSVIIHDGGSGYEGGPITRAEVVGDGTGAVIGLSINPSTGSITAVRVLNSGQNYTTGHVNIITIDGYGEGKYGNAHAVLEPNFVGGKLDSVSIIDPGVGYSTDSQTNIVVSGTGEGAVLYPIIENGTLVDVIIASPGRGYSEVHLSIESVTGTGAEISVAMGMGDVDSVQSNIELLAIPGAVHVVDVLNAGTGYVYASCKVTGDGTGLSLTPVIHDGRIVRIEVDNPGQGYTWCNIEVEGTGVGASLKPVISPIGGHGSNAISELFAHSLCIYGTVNINDPSVSLLNNDYRQFGVVRNIRQTDNIQVYRGASVLVCDVVQTSLATEVALDEEFSLETDESVKFYIAGTDGKQRVAIQNPNKHALTPGEKLINSQHTLTVNDVEISPANKFSGEVLFIDNRTSIYQSKNQFLSIRSVIKF